MVGGDIVFFSDNGLPIIRAALLIDSEVFSFLGDQTFGTDDCH